MSSRPINVKVIYRNYIPLNSPYFSLSDYPPKGIKFHIEKPKKFLSKFFWIYKRFKSYKLILLLSGLVESIFFKNTDSSDQFDYYYYIGIVPPKLTPHKFVVDLEHIFFLTRNATDEASKENLLDLLMQENCIAIAPISHAAKETLRLYLGERYKKIDKKVKVIYPSLPDYSEIYSKDISNEIIPSDNKVKLLFVGKDSYRKGLYEVLEAFKILSLKYKNLSLYVVSDTPSELIESVKGLNNVFFFNPSFSSKEIITKFFLPSDIFVMPTHEYTFGMVFLEALSAGIPFVTTRQFATTEIGKDNVNALFLDNPPLFLDKDIIVTARFGKDYLLDNHEGRTIIEELVKKLSFLMDNPKSLSDLKSNTRVEFEDSGKFSIHTRNNSYYEIFK